MIYLREKRRLKKCFESNITFWNEKFRLRGFQIQDWSRSKTWVFPYEVFSWERLRHLFKRKMRILTNGFFEKLVFRQNIFEDFLRDIGFCYRNDRP